MGSAANDHLPIPRLPANTRLLLAALAIGFAGGALAHRLGDPVLLGAADLIAPLGSLWTDALRLLAVPPVVSVLVWSIAGFSGGGAIGRMGVLAAIVFGVILIAGAVLTIFGTPLALTLLPPTEPMAIPEASAAAAQEAAAQGPATVLDALRGLLSFDLAASIGRGELLPILFLAAVFGLALSRIPEPPKCMLLGVIGALVQALFVVLGWLLWVAPAGVFALTYVMAARYGAGSAGILGASLVIMIVLLIIMTGAMYPAAALIGGVSLSRFARGVAPAQLVAVSTRSSLASLPALLEGSERVGVPAPVAGFVLPFSVALFKPNRAISGPMKLFVIAHMYGIELTPSVIIVFVLTNLMLSIGTPGIPATGGTMPTLPALLAAGMPIEGIILLNAIDVLPDIFKTLLNVTANMTATVIVARLSGHPIAQAAGSAASAGPIAPNGSPVATPAP